MTPAPKACSLSDYMKTIAESLVSSHGQPTLWKTINTSGMIVSIQGKKANNPKGKVSKSNMSHWHVPSRLQAHSLQDIHFRLIQQKHSLRLFYSNSSTTTYYHVHRDRNVPYHQCQAAELCYPARSKRWHSSRRRLWAIHQHNKQWASPWSHCPLSHFHS